jgi:hypothetical protein
LIKKSALHFHANEKFLQKKVLRLRHHFFLGAAFFATDFLTSGFFAAAFFAAAMWFPPPTGIGYIFFKFIN